MTAQWTLRTDRRTALAEQLLNAPDRMRAAGLLARDLQIIVDNGQAARAADREQKAQLAEVATTRAGRKAQAAAVREREDWLRARLPLVVDDLRTAGESALADWLTLLSVKRYRYRELVRQAEATESAASEATRAEAQRVERIERTDLLSRLSGLVAFCEVILAPGREPVVAALAARGFDRAALEALSEEADALVQAGNNQLVAAEATEREARHAAAQTAQWAKCRRAIRTAVEGDPTLERLLAGC